MNDKNDYDIEDFDKIYTEKERDKFGKSQFWLGIIYGFGTAILIMILYKPVRHFLGNLISSIIK